MLSNGNVPFSRTPGVRDVTIRKRWPRNSPSPKTIKSTIASHPTTSQQRSPGRHRRGLGRRGSARLRLRLRGCHLIKTHGLVAAGSHRECPSIWTPRHPFSPLLGLARNPMQLLHEMAIIEVPNTHRQIFRGTHKQRKFGMPFHIRNRCVVRPKLPLNRKSFSIAQPQMARRPDQAARGRDS